MKKILLSFILFIIPILTFSQKFDLNLYDELRGVDFSILHDYIKDSDKNFDQTKVSEDGKTYSYMKTSDGFGYAIMLNITEIEVGKNKLEIMLASNFRLDDIVDILELSGYKKENENADGVLVYKKDNKSYFINQPEEIDVLLITTE